MLELAKRFINKECIIYTFGSNDFSSNQINGMIKEVSNGAILLETDGNTQAVNLDFIIRIREHPRNKSGQKKPVVWD